MAMRNNDSNEVPSGTSIQKYTVNCSAFVIFLFLILVGATPAFGQFNVTFFGPETFARTQGKPQVQTAAIVLPPVVKGPYTLMVSNGSVVGTDRVSSASIVLNGAEVLGPSDFNQQVAMLQREVSLLPSNTLEVQLRSAPGSYVAISVTGVVSGDQILAKTTSQIDSTGGAVVLPGIATLNIPPGAASSSSIEIDAVVSPIMDFLAPELDSSFALINVPRIRIKSSASFSGPVRLQISAPNISNMLNQGSQVTFAALVRQLGADEESMDSLEGIGGHVCGVNAALCVTILPDWFANTDPFDPADPVIQVAAGTIPSIPGTSVPFMSLSNVQPSGASLTESTTQTLSVLGQLTLTPFAAQAPVSPFILSQGFSWSGPHHGVDLAVPNGTLVVAPLPGTVDPTRYGQQPSTGKTRACKNPTRIIPQGGGIGLWLLHQKDLSINLSTYYAHLEEQLVSRSEHVGELDSIALSDSTGGSCGPHLHFEVHFGAQPINPMPLLLNNIDMYLPLTLTLSLDGTLGAMEEFDGRSGSFQLDQSFQGIAPGTHTLSLELISPNLGSYVLQMWTVDVKAAQISSIQRITYNSLLIDSLPGTQFPRGGTYTAVIDGTGLADVTGFSASDPNVTGSVVSATDTQVTVQITSTPVPPGQTQLAPIPGVGFSLLLGSLVLSSGSVAMDIVAGSAPQVIAFTVTNGVSAIPRGIPTTVAYSSTILDSGNVQFFAVGCGACMIQFLQGPPGSQFETILPFLAIVTIPANSTDTSFSMAVGAVDGAGQGQFSQGGGRILSIPII
jgi:hypothetical protein